MSKHDFDININGESVSVHLNAPPKTRFYASGFFILLVALGMCVALFLPGKHSDPSMWHHLASSPVESGTFKVWLLIFLSFPVLAFLLMRRYVIAAFPSNEAFHCDRSTLTISKVHYLDVHNTHWDTRTYQLADVRDIRYRAIISTKDATIYGLRFVAGGRKQKILPGLGPRDAEKILQALKTFGADVPDDPKLQQKIKDDVPGQWP
jgi:hypothetical protein